uniref:Acetyltransferase n=1 Tax=Daucus carota subsp. sativus TaxID=79200 RepID=A0A164TWI4_DAUCS
MCSQPVQHISEYFIKPSHLSQDSKQVIHLATWDLAMLSFHYIQRGLLFRKPEAQDNFIQVFLQKLKDALSLTLAHFYPLAGRLAKKQDSHSFVLFVDCVNSPGARFVHSSVDTTVSDILSPPYVPMIVRSFFDHHKAVNYDGLNMSLLTVQVTELIDGIFIGCSINHSVADGTSFWNFFNTLSAIFQGSGVTSPPIHERWFPDGYGPFFRLPFTRDDQFITRYDAPILKEKIFHFSVANLARIKAKTNALCKDRAVRISSLQAFKLLANNFEWAALQLNKTILEHNDKSVRKSVATWLQTQRPNQLGQLADPGNIVVSSSPRFNMYGNEFGFGKPVAVLGGYGNLFNGRVTLFQGSEGGGSIDTGICLNPKIMNALECDEEFLDALNSSRYQLKTPARLPYLAKTPQYIKSLKFCLNLAISVM